MTTGIIHQEQSLENHIQKNMGCMAGFFNLSHLLPGKRFSPKRLPPSSSSTIDSSSDTTVSTFSSFSSPAPAFSSSSEISKPQPSQLIPDQSKPKPKSNSPLSTTTNIPNPPLPPTSPPPLPPLLKEAVRTTVTPWKFAREAPRLSLDSRFVVDAKGSLHPREIKTNDDDDRRSQHHPSSSPSVVARLMGLEPLTAGGRVPEPEIIGKVQLRRSASESRSRDLIQFPALIESNKFELNSSMTMIRDRFDDLDQITQKLNASKALLNQVAAGPKAGSIKPERSRERRPPQPQVQQQKRSHFDAADFFPEPKNTAATTILGEIERRLRMSGIEEPSKDLDTLKQILEAIQLKGLLHAGRRNLVYDDDDHRRFFADASPIVVMKPANSPVQSQSPKPANRRNVESYGENFPLTSPRRERTKTNRNENRSVSASPTRRKAGALSVEREREAGEQRRGSSPVQSPRNGGWKVEQTAAGSRSPKGRRSTVEICRRERKIVRAEDEASTVSESSHSSCSHGDTERWKATGEDPNSDRRGRTLLERCDKLLHSIAEMTSPPPTTTTPTSNATTTCLVVVGGSELQPSPVSVLDSSFNKDDDEELPSPIMKRTIDFKEEHELVLDQEDHEMPWSLSSSGIQLNHDSDSSDLAYVSDVLRASDYLHSGNTDLFLFLEKQQLLKGEDQHNSSLIRRRLIFDTISEILDRVERLPQRNATSPLRNFVPDKPSLSQIWSELQRIRDPVPTDNLFDTICGVLKRDLADDSVSGWGDHPVETSDTVLDIERLVFKDLIGEAIRDLASLSGDNVSMPPRRKLVF